MRITPKSVAQWTDKVPTEPGFYVVMDCDDGFFPTFVVVVSIGNGMLYYIVGHGGFSYENVVAALSKSLWLLVADIDMEIEPLYSQPIRQCVETLKIAPAFQFESMPEFNRFFQREMKRIENAEIVVRTSNGTVLTVLNESKEEKNAPSIQNGNSNNAG